MPQVSPYSFVFSQKVQTRKNTLIVIPRELYCLILLSAYTLRFRNRVSRARSMPDHISSASLMAISSYLEYTTNGNSTP